MNKMENRVNEEDERAFEQLLSESLKQMPGVSLPTDFATKMAGKMSESLETRRIILEFLLRFGTVVGVLAILVGCVYYADSGFVRMTISDFADKSGFILPIGGVLLFTLFMDQVILKFMWVKKRYH